MCYIISWTYILCGHEGDMAPSVIPYPKCYTIVGDCSPVSELIVLPLAGICPDCAVQLRSCRSRKNRVKKAYGSTELLDDEFMEQESPGEVFQKVSSSDKLALDPLDKS